MSGVLSQSEIDYLLNDISREVSSKKNANDSVFTEYKGNDIVYSVPEEITRIEEKAFSSCVSLETIIIPSTLREIGAGAFSECKSLKNIKIPDSVIEIKDNTFFSASNVKNIGKAAFSNWINNEKYFFEINESKCEKLSSALENKTVSTGDEINKLFSPFMTEVFTNEKYVNNMDAVKVLKRM